MLTDKVALPPRKRALRTWIHRLVVPCMQSKTCVSVEPQPRRQDQRPWNYPQSRYWMSLPWACETGMSSQRNWKPPQYTQKQRTDTWIVHRLGVLEQSHMGHEPSERWSYCQYCFTTWHYEHNLRECNCRNKATTARWLWDTRWSAQTQSLIWIG